MSHSSSAIIDPPSTRGFSRSVPSSYSQLSSKPSIHVLDNDSLLNIFYLYRPVILVDIDVEVRADDFNPLRWGEWTRERWWHKLTHVCQRWRRIIFASASYLGLCVVCTYGTPVARILECYPTLPIVIDYPYETRRWTVEDEDGILLALRHRARVCRIRLYVPHSYEGKLLVAIEMEFPVLEYLCIEISSLAGMRPGLEVHHTFQAPRLCHLALTRCPLLVTSPSLMTCAGLVALSLSFPPLLCHHHPYDLFKRLSLLSQLVVLNIDVVDTHSTHRLEEQQFDIPFITHLTLSNLRLFEFEGYGNYLETLLPWITTPILENLQITVLRPSTTHYPTYTFPRLQRFMNRADFLSFSSATFRFTAGGGTVWVYPREGARAYVFYLCIITRRFHLQVSEMAEMFEGLTPALSTVVDLTIDCEECDPRYEIPGLRNWRDLLRPFNRVKTLSVHGFFAKQFSYSLLSGPSREPLPEVLPELQVLECSEGNEARGRLATLVNGRKVAGYPIRLVLVDSPGNSPPNTGL